MPNYSPYRLACTNNGTIPMPPIAGNCCINHAASGTVTAPQFVYSGTVADPCGGPGVAPYERYADNSGGAACESNGCGSTCSAPCFDYKRDEIPTPVYTSTGTNVNFTVKHKTGFKNVMALRRWNGRYGYNTMAVIGNPDNVVGCPALSTVLRWQGFQARPDRTKYRKLAVTAEWHGTLYDDSGTVLADNDTTCDYTMTIDPHSGIFSVSGFSVSPNAYDWGAVEIPVNSNQAINQAFRAHWQWGDIISRMTNVITPTAGLTITYGTNSITLTNPSLPGTGLIESLVWSINVGGTSTFTRNVYVWGQPNGNPPPQQYLTYNEVVTVTGTALNYSSSEFDYGCWFGPSAPDLTQKILITVTGTLSNAVSDTDIYNDACNNLLVTWPLNDDKLYPWRTDTRLSVAPLVAYDDIIINDFPPISQWMVRDFGAPVANGLFSANPGDNMPEPTWDGISGVILTPTDINSGTEYVSIIWSTSNGDTSINGTSVGNSLAWVLSPTYVSYTGTLPPGISLNLSTGVFSGTVSGIPATSPYFGSGIYGITVKVTGPPAATGSIIGAPKPAGYQNTFDFNFIDYRGCCETSTDFWDWYIYGWGQPLGYNDPINGSSGFNGNTRSNIPYNATHWDNWWESINKPQGAWLFFNDQASYFGPSCGGGSVSGVFNADALWVCKYAEILDGWHSQNFDRPAGADKFTYDESQPVYCVTNISGSGAGSTWNLTTWDATVPSSATFPGNWGGASVAGFYSGCSYTGGVLTLGTKVFNAPSDWTSAASGLDTGTCFGVQRFPSCPSLLGRAAIRPDSLGTTFTFSVPQTSFGMASTEQVDIFDASMTALASNVTATRVDDTHFTTTGSYPTAKWVMIHGAPNWFFNDSDPKGDYVVLDFLTDLRSSGEHGRVSGITDCSGSPITNTGSITYQNADCNSHAVTTTLPNNGYAQFCQTAGCRPFMPCVPKVVCISPNGESFPNGTTYPFPGMALGGALPSSNTGFYFDETYGIKWWGWVQQTMTDLLWQPPHPPCGFTVNSPPADVPEILIWRMDDGTCQADFDEDFFDPDSGAETIKHHRFYAYAPQVEARITVPCNYGTGLLICGPPLPPGIQIGWLSPVNNTVGDVAAPPVPPGVDASGDPNLAFTATLLHSRECTSVATGCRFPYQNSVEGCK